MAVVCFCCCSCCLLLLFTLVVCSCYLFLLLLLLGRGGSCGYYLAFHVIFLSSSLLYSLRISRVLHSYFKHAMAHTISQSKATPHHSFHFASHRAWTAPSCLSAVLACATTLPLTSARTTWVKVWALWEWVGWWGWVWMWAYVQAQLAKADLLDLPCWCVRKLIRAISLHVFRSLSWFRLVPLNHQPQALSQ